MPTSNQAGCPSTHEFIEIFDIASDEYNRLTGQDLHKHPLATDLDTCRNPQDVSKLLQAHAQAFSKFSEGDKMLMKWLDPTVNILYTFSATLEGVGLNTILAGKSNLHWYRCSSRRCERRCGKPRAAHPALRAYSLLPPTTGALHKELIHGRTV
ncbi:hypothetical protein BC826DRAFT_1040382 [Russula brevipes]|nr:hypothetical protein BC826DRAFT_1040382 [Russula brevipes]